MKANENTIDVLKTKYLPHQTRYQRKIILKQWSFVQEVGDDLRVCVLNLIFEVSTLSNLVVRRLARVEIYFFFFNFLLRKWTYIFFFNLSRGLTLVTWSKGHWLQGWQLQGRALPSLVPIGLQKMEMHCI